ncbi:secreted salivary gland peptide, putative [Ixodes scapularis]|uniref:Secreted salivary gland peptide, putative n=1 Tax=Ixodes scapularis TaxID=6945 RepID=B7PJ93_IXOSC|nr:secreted salivary gland peptide, putative [Ixodes scapularis]|eukprot:XP_002407403.1 secreted salivary gland peptide, putative [Ixodes scapularis]
MNAAFIAALLILGTLTLDAMPDWDQLAHCACETDSDCGSSGACQCREPRGDFPGKYCFPVWR